MPVEITKINTSSPQLSNPAFKTGKSDLLDTEERKLYGIAFISCINLFNR